MTTNEKIARRKLSMLQLAKELGNVSRACAIMGYSRQQFYEIRRNFQTYGAEGLLDRLPGPKGPHPNRVSAEIEQAVLDHALEHPCHGQLRVEQELRLKGVQVSAGGIRGVWMRHGLLTKHERLLRLEKATAERKLQLSDEQVRLLERFSPEFRERHIEAPHTGSLVAVDTFFVGALKGVGKVWLQTAIDCHSRRAPPRSPDLGAFGVGAADLLAAAGPGSTPASCRSPRCISSTRTCCPPSRRRIPGSRSSSATTVASSAAGRTATPTSSSSSSKASSIASAG